MLNFRAVAWRPPEDGSAPGFVVPPIVEILDHLEEGEFTGVHTDTAGAMGLLALLAARLLHLPVSGTFAEQDAGRYALWFYGQLDQVQAPTRAAARELVARGLDPGRVRF